MLANCPKCGHSPLPFDQALPVACPACGVILAKLAQTMSATTGKNVKLPVHSNQHNLTKDQTLDEPSTFFRYLFHTPERIDSFTIWIHLALLFGFAVWGLTLIAQDYRTGEMGASFIHRPLLIFHEAGHVVFRLFGEWVSVLGGTLGQLIMPAILGCALLIKNRDPFGAAIGLWFVGVSLLDIAPYMYDALHPKLMLLSGTTGEDGGHDWIYLFSSMGLLQKAQVIAGLIHKLGALTVLLALAWGAGVLRIQHAVVPKP